MSSVADILNQFYSSYKNRYTPSVQQAKAAKDIMRCKTAALGAHVYECEECGHKSISYNS
jgi:hypothetical protein